LTQTFTDLGLPQGLVASLAKAGFVTPTPIQSKAIPPQMEGKDILGIAQTGSGKTAAFALPMLAAFADGVRPNPRTARALVLAPTRELAVQIEEAFRKFSGNRLSTVLVLGGMSRNAQIVKLSKGVDVCIATPGRLKDLIDDRKIDLRATEYLVLDEADRMLDMGFIKPVREIAAAIGPKRKTALFSATMATEVSELAKSLLKDPVRVEATPPATTVGSITQSVIFASTPQKRGTLNQLLGDAALDKVIVFARTKHGADKVTKHLKLDGFEAAAIHGNKSQNARQAALKGFTDGRVRVLVATDIVARGIDVPGISHVINYDLPDDADSYVHRIGRTARNGASGVAITLCDPSERSKLRDVERLIRKTLPFTQSTAEIIQNAPSAKGDRDDRPAQRPQGQKRPQGGRAGEGQGRPQQRAPRPHGERPHAGHEPKQAWWEKSDRPAGHKPAGQPHRGGAARPQRAGAGNGSGGPNRGVVVRSR